jgi:molybdenum cofactor synthesis domain-containing protein
MTSAAVASILVLTLSDRAAEGQYADRSGERIKQLLQEFFATRTAHPVITGRVLPDDPAQLRRAVQHAIQCQTDVVITTGGTGVGPRDITPETVAPLCDKLIPGIMEHIRAKYGAQFPRARLSRSLAGVAGKTQIYCLPGSVRAVEEYLPIILETLEHVAGIIAGGDVHG